MKKLLIVVALLEVVTLLGLAFARPRERSPGAGVTPPGPESSGGSTVADASAPVTRGAENERASRPSPTGGAEPPNAEPAADDPLGIVLFGKVTDKNGEPVPAGSVSFANGRADDSASANIKPGRGYCVTGLLPGRWQLYASGEGFVASRQWLELTAAPRVRRLDLVLERTFPLKVKILTPDGQPLYELVRAAQERRELDHTTDGLTAMATNEPLPIGPLANPQPSRTTREKLGRWQPGHGYQDMKEMPKEYAGTLLLNQPPPCCVSAMLEHVVVASEHVLAGADEVTLRVSLDELLRQRGTVRAQLVDAATGAPLAGVQTSFYPWNMGGGGGTKTDAEGRVVFKDIVPGWRKLEVFAKDLEHLGRRVLVQPGSDLDLGVIRLSTGLSVEVQVVDARGNPAQIERLTCTLLDPSRADDSGASMAWGVDADGRVTIKPAPRGRVLLRISQRPRGPQGWTIVDTSGGPVSGVRLEARASVPLRIVNDTNEDRVWSVAVRSADDLPIAEAELWAPESELFLPTGSFVADIKKGGVVQRSVPITVGERGATLRVP